MSESTATEAAPTETSTETETEQTETVEQAPDLAAEVDKWKALSKKNEERAKANAKAAQELEEFRKQSMTETEKAIEQARTEGRIQALSEAGGKVAAAEIRAAAAGRMAPEQVDTLLDGLNLARFLDDDGEVDRSKVTAFVDGIAPKPTEDEGRQPFPDLGQGARGGQNAALNGDPLLRDLKSKLGIR